MRRWVTLLEGCAAFFAAAAVLSSAGSCAAAAQCATGPEGDAHCAELLGAAGALCVEGTCVRAALADADAPPPFDAAERPTDGGVQTDADASCALFEGVCDGNRVVSVAAGYDSACAVLAAGVVYCWGRGREGQIGVDPLDTPFPPTRVPGLDHVVAVDVGRGLACALREAETTQVLCWGANSHGQLGHAPGSQGDRVCQGGETGWCNPTPTVVTGLNPVMTLAVSRADPFVCVLTRAGHVNCWGRNQEGILGPFGPSDGGSTHVPANVMNGIVTDASRNQRTLCSGINFACAVERTNRQVRCWGSNLQGQLGGATRGGFQSTPAHVLTSAEAGAPPLSQAHTLACGSLGAHALTPAGRWFWWPSTQREGDATLTEYFAGEGWRCGRENEGDYDCLRTGSDAGVAFRGTQVSVGYNYVLGVDDDGVVWRWSNTSDPPEPVRGFP